MLEIFTNLMKNINLHIQETQQVLAIILNTQGLNTVINQQKFAE